MSTSTQTFIAGFLCCLLASCGGGGGDAPAPTQNAASGNLRTLNAALVGPETIDLVFIGDGFTAAEEQAFYAEAEELATAMLASAPFTDDAYEDRINVHAIFVASNESGADHPSQGVHRDTAFDATYDTHGIERLLTANAARVQATAFSYVPQYDHAFLIVNDSMHGGSGGAIAVVSTHWANALTALHEYGHIAADLADEYEDPYPGYPAGDWEPNVTYQTDRNTIPWRDLIADSTPVPTPEDHYDLTKAGLYEGARYLSSGIHRSHIDCRMRTLSYGVPFCPVCERAMNDQLRIEAGLTPAAPPQPEPAVESDSEDDDSNPHGSA